MRLTDRNELTTPHNNDLLHIVDVSDLSDSPQGSSKKIKIGNLDFQSINEKGIANGYTPLNSSTKIDSAYLPSYVDDVLEYSSLSAFPAVGETGKIYIAKDTNFTYRWGGSSYVQVGGGGSGDVESVFGRIGNVVAVTGDYDASQITNDSGVSGTNVDDALDWLNSNKINTTTADSKYLLNTTDTLTGDLTVTSSISGATITSSGRILAGSGLNSGYGVVTENANSILDLPSNTFFNYSNSTGSTNFPTEFGQSFGIRGGSDNRSFFFYKPSGNNNSLYFSDYTGSAWRHQQIWHSGNFTPSNYYTKAESDGNYILKNARTDGGYAWIRRNGGTPLYITQQGSGNILEAQQGAGDGVNIFTINQNGDVDLTGGGDVYFKSSGRIRRYSHVAGFLEGSYQTVGNNSAKTNPIYTIGSSYIPDEETLNNMYGIGYAQGSSASFLNSTDLGTNPGSWGLYVASNGTASIFLEAGNGHGRFFGNVYAAGFFENSDKRLKENIQPLTEGLKTLEKINTYSYSWKKNNKEDIGVIAQEIEEILPIAVNTDDSEEGMKSVNYTKLIPVLINAVKELSEEVKQLKNG
ncbi:tail fiber domain-containing protein [Galbibacter pacificus]|uniref:Tail fiber domain-containing protein n=1 Tax=Galbibacter pacificus TaxID=2996052 RepID=A0ABT6FQC8_9FLAO|nr:tail fiber domain-containing protein [Galbibacter pacificus]MDG3582056.1 tail fiber domain-containing protein [Galbibacter pacificus]MDG3585470.1 tail fiber domain-containing protein [Galbibacter pacificus]